MADIDFVTYADGSSESETVSVGLWEIAMGRYNFVHLANRVDTISEPLAPAPIIDLSRHHAIIFGLEFTSA